jgi:hypothetical protein
MRGGKREGSGRKKSQIETENITFRISKQDKIYLKESYQNLNSLFCKFVDYLKFKQDER